MIKIHRKLYNWMLSWADSKYSSLALFAFAFAESSVFPVPPDILLGALVIGNVKKWFKFACICTLGSLIGGLFGYLIGYAAWNSIGLWILEHILRITPVMVDGRADILLPTYLTTHFSSALGGEYLFQVYDKWNAWIVFIFGLTPLPYKLVTITAGVAGVNLWIFSLASIFSRGLRFSVVALILRIGGEPATKFIDKHFNLITILFTVLLIGGFVLIGMFF